MGGVGVAASNGVVDEMLVRRSRGGVYLVKQAQVCLEKCLLVASRPYHTRYKDRSSDWSRPVVPAAWL